MSHTAFGLARAAQSAARARPEHLAVVLAGAGGLSYGALEGLSDRLRDQLVAGGLSPGERVGLLLPKSADAVAAILGVQKAGGVHVPVDPGSPPARNAAILADCAASAVVIERSRAEPLRAEWGARCPALLVLDGPADGSALRRALDARPVAPVAATLDREPEALAMILYTSGTTGRPKGVMIPARAVAAFTAWCVAALSPRPEDRFANHAPLHFDLSVLDLFTAFAAGATVVLIGEEDGSVPLRLAERLESERISVLYATPSVLSRLAHQGRLAGRALSLRWVLFAGEVFAPAALRALSEQVPGARYANLYGPTETNVCTAYEIPRPVPADRSEPYPIGRPLPHVRARRADPDQPARDAPPDAAGELLIAGDGVMSGYWGDLEATALAFVADAEGTRWYRTGDLVCSDPAGYRFLGRRDRQVKKRGYRIELGEVEAALLAHPQVTAAAVLGRPDEERGLLLEAHLATAAPLSILALKQHCAARLPAYMVPDTYTLHAALPLTSTGKIDLAALRGDR